MSKAAKIPKKTRQQLAQKIVELESQLAFRYHYAEKEIDKLGQTYMMASGIVLQAHALGGRVALTPVLIRDGLSDDTIAALKRDVLRSYNLAVELKPKG